MRDDIPLLVLRTFGPGPCEDFAGYEFAVKMPVDTGQPDGDLISYVGLTTRMILIEGKPVEVGGIGFVVTDPHYRGRGFMRAAMNEAHHRCAAMELPYVLLNAGAQEMYAKFGYRHPPNLPGPWMVLEMPVMRDGETIGAYEWNDQAEIDLRGTW